MKNYLVALFLQLALLCSSHCHAQKRIYIPEDLRSMQLDSDTSRWCWRRSAETRDVVFFWERGFGSDLQAPPQLEGKPMDFNLSVLMDRVQSFYTFYRDTLKFTLPGSKADTYKMMVMVNYSLDGTAYGGSYDNFIGALWVAPNRIQDKTMNCMAHELGHSFQSQIMADSVGKCWGGTGFFEMASQWMLWQVNPWWLRDENYLFKAFKTLTHKAFLAMENIYHSPYVLQWWSDLHGRESIAELFRQGRIGEDPVLTYQRMYGLSQQQFCDELFLGYQHLVNIDFHHAWEQTRPYAGTWNTPLDTLNGGWLQPKDTLEDYGFHIIPLPEGYKGTPKVKGTSLRWTVVGISTDDRTVYNVSRSGGHTADGSHIPFSLLKKRFLLVMAAPEEHRQLAKPFGRKRGTKPRLYPYQFRF